MNDSHSPWWKLFPRPGCPHGKLQLHPSPGQEPVYKVGDVVRLAGKPEKARKIIQVEWHSHCHEFVYIVETRRGDYRAYWYAGQLISNADWLVKRNEWAGEA